MLGSPISAPLFGKRIFWSVNAAWKGRELHVQFEKKSSVYSVLLSLPQRLVKMLSKSAHLSTIHYYAFYISDPSCGTGWSWIDMTYRKVTSISLFCLEVLVGFFRLAMTGKFDVFYCDLLGKSWFSYCKHVLILTTLQ